ncbi:FUSC family membrane protein [Sodalis-like endosymbiont of Proechinophthirus fluctus]|uniref:FUSC family membrane protein n=1 Tax=Sodalis-like endosymbiont of Proechinophthirus fluctus TaxID=1462730 RepID=UPI003F75627B
MLFALISILIHLLLSSCCVVGIAVRRKRRNKPACMGRLLSASLIVAVFTLGLTGNVPLWLSSMLHLAGTAWYRVV